jgi:hypothetical protein
MRPTFPRPARSLVPALLLCLAACASTPPPLPDGIEIPPEAVQNVRRESNGDVITEYRVGGQLVLIHVQPPRGPGYYLYLRDGRVHSTRTGDDPPQTYFKLFGW